MSELNGDRARFQKNRKRKMLLRQRTRALLAQIQQKNGSGGASPAVDPLATAQGAPRKG